jgi:hypothetical protein
MTQKDTVDRISAEILYYEIATRNGIEWIQMYLTQAYAAGYDHYHQIEQKEKQRKLHVFP